MSWWRVNAHAHAVEHKRDVIALCGGVAPRIPPHYYGNSVYGHQEITDVPADPCEECHGILILRGEVKVDEIAAENEKIDAAVEADQRRRHTGGEA